MCRECRFQVMEVGWSKGSWSRCIVEPTRLRRVFSVRVGVILSGKRAGSVARREDGDGRVLPSHTSSIVGGWLERDGRRAGIIQYGNR